MMLILNESIFYYDDETRACKYHCRSFADVTDAPEKGYGEYFDNEQRPQNDYIRLHREFLYVYIQNWKYCFVYWACITETITYYRRKSFQQSSPRQRYISIGSLCIHAHFCPCVKHCSGFLFTMSEFWCEWIARRDTTMCSCVRIMLLRTKIHHNLNVSRSLLRCTHNSKQ